VEHIQTNPNEIHMSNPSSIAEYLSQFSQELGDRILKIYPALQAPKDPVWPELQLLKRHPFPAQTLAIMAIAKHWQNSRCAAAVVTLTKSWPNRPGYGLIQGRPNYGLTWTTLTEFS
jgi:hypothetical protein